MRYSLATFFLVCLWVSLAVLAWTRHEAWLLDGRPFAYQPDERAAVRTAMAMTSPDGTRCFEPGSPIRMVEPNTGALVYNFMAATNDFVRKTGKGIAVDGFMDDDTVVFALIPTMSFGKPDEGLVFRRRFPEWWWGHFYRPEVWALLVLTCVLGVRSVRWKRKAGNPSKIAGA
jgi:hypothetical protein